MSLIFRYGGSALALSLAVVLSGCATSNETADATDHMIMCPKCETVWRIERKGHGSKVRVTHFSRDMTCETCDKTAKAYFEDGKLTLHNCPTCKVTPKVLKPRRPISHLGHKHH